MSTTESDSNVDIRKVPPTGEIFNRCAMMVQIMLACYVYERPWEKISSRGWNSSAVKDIRYTLHKNGLIDADHKITKKGICWVKAIFNTPFPTEQTEYKVIYAND